MSEAGKSYRQILRSTSVIGGASVINILIGLVRVKVAAVLLGPAGVGLIGLFGNLIATAASVAALGIDKVGTRQIAEAEGRGDAMAIAVARRALFWGTLTLAVLGTLGFWLLRDVLATHVLADATLGDEVGWLALGVGLTVAAGSQGALLNGLRRIGDLARINVYSAVLATVLGSGALLLWHEQGLVVYLLLAPLASCAVGSWYVRRLPKLQAPPAAVRELAKKWGSLARLGFAIMLAGLAMTVGQLVVRTLVQRELGTEALGLFEASWVISMTYVGAVLHAMGSDYYPRLTATIDDHSAVNTLVNEQTEVALLLAGPVFLGMLALAPWVVELLYSSRFSEAASVLRWQILGDLLKVASFPLGFLILAAGDGRTFVVSDSIASAVFVLSVAIGLPHLGIQAAGTGCLAMYLVYLPIVYLHAKSRTGFAWSPGIVKLGACLMACSVAIAAGSAVHRVGAAAVGLLLALGFAGYAVARLHASIPALAVLSGKWSRRPRRLD